MTTTPLSPRSGFIVINCETLAYKAVGNQLQFTNTDGASVMTLEGDEATAALATVQAAVPK
jgi:hypothetical protein